MILQSKWFNKCLLLVALVLSAPAQAAVTIDNDLATSTLGYLAINVDNAGESREGYITGQGTPSNTLFENQEVIYDYYTYLDTGTGGGRLSASVTVPAALTGDDEVTSSGSFTGSGNNSIDWQAVSVIEDDGELMTTTYTFTAQSGTLGLIRLYQYLDEDVLGSGNDVFFTRGSTAGLDLQLYTIDNAEAIGISHSGALSIGQGLQNAMFAGYAACTYNNMQPAIIAGTQSVNSTGSLCASLASNPINHPEVGPALGPVDVVSVMAWDVDPDAATATIISTLGGVPDITDLPPPPPSDMVPVPALSTVGLVLLGFLMLLMVGIRRHNRFH